MKITFDPAKRDRILAERGLDLARADELFADYHLTRYDTPHSIDEDRFISVGLLKNSVVIVIWTLREDIRRIVTMWKANGKERQNYHRQRDRSG